MRNRDSYIELNGFDIETLYSDSDNAEDLHYVVGASSSCTFRNPIYKGNGVYNSTTEMLIKEDDNKWYNRISKKKIAIACASVITLSALSIMLSKLLHSHDDDYHNMTTEEFSNVTTSFMTTAFSNVTSSISSITNSIATLFPANITSPTTEDPRCIQLPECCDNEGRWICT